MKTKLLSVALILLVLLMSCKKDYNVDNEEITATTTNSKENYMSDFTIILSKLVYENRSVRGFLKDEALKKFDKNYNVLYYIVKDRKIEGKTFRELLVAISSEKEIAQIEKNVPLLNILIPEISFFKINAENLNIEDKEIPVAINTDKGTQLYLNGKVEMTVPNGEVPDFHVLVIRENDRVDPTSINYNNNKSLFASISQDVNNENEIRFLSPNYDNISNKENKIEFTSVNTNDIHPIVLKSYNYFYSDSHIPNLKAYQRDYIYYGIKNKDDRGSLNHNVKDYLNYIEVDPKAYFGFNLDSDTKGNPTIKENKVTVRRRPLSTSQLLDRMWTKGSYEFKFTIINGDNTIPSSIKIPLTPSDLWEFNIEYNKKRGSLFRRSKHTYKIDPNRFTSKIVHLNKLVPFEKWDIANTTTVKYVSIVEENRGAEKIIEDSYTFETAEEGKFSQGLKIGISEGSGFNYGGDVTKTTKKTTTKSSKIVYKVENDVLANNYKVYFYDPVITSRGDKTKLYVYDTGIIRFSVTPYFQ